MNRSEFIASLKLDSLPIEAIEAFYRGLPARIPGGSSDQVLEVRRTIEHHLADLNAAMLDRQADHRVPVDIEAMADQIADRMRRYGSQDWERAAPSGTLLDYARALAGEISADLRTATPLDPWPGDDDWSGDERS